MAVLPKFFYYKVHVVGPTKIELEDCSYADVVEVVRCRNCIYGEVDEELARERFEESKDEWHKEHRKKISEYCKSLGNCEEVNIPGSHGISDQHPEELVKEIEKLISRIK